MSTINITPEHGATVKDVAATLTHPGCPDTATVRTLRGRWHAVGPQSARHRPEPWGDFDGWIYNFGELFTDDFSEAVRFASQALEARAHQLKEEKAQR